MDEAIKHLEGTAKLRGGGKMQPYGPTFLLHFAVAVRAMRLSPQAAQEFYAHLGETFVESYYSGGESLVDGPT